MKAEFPKTKVTLDDLKRGDLFEISTSPLTVFMKTNKVEAGSVGAVVVGVPANLPTNKGVGVICYFCGREEVKPLEETEPIKLRYK